MTNIVTIRGLDHSYGQTHALRGVDLTVGAGECVALLGPNGAGKTTLVSTLTGMLAPTAGSVRIDGWSRGGRSALADPLPTPMRC